MTANLDEENTRLANLIKFHRKKSGLSRIQLSHYSGVGKTVIYDIEHGKISIKFDTLLKILKVLNIKIEFMSPLMEEFKGNKNASSQSI